VTGPAAQAEREKLKTIRKKMLWLLPEFL